MTLKKLDKLLGKSDDEEDDKEIEGDLDLPPAAPSKRQKKVAAARQIDN